MPRPAFVLVPGASHQPTIYNALATILSNHSYEVHPIALPSVVTPGNRATYDFTEDVNSIRNLVSSLVHANKEVILVMHSYSGLPGSEALRGLGRIDREREGKRGGVVRLIFVMGWMGKEGFQGAERGDISSFFPYLRPDVAAGTLTIDPQEAPSIYYNDLPLPEARYWTSQLLPQSIGVFWSRITYAAWRYIPSTYVLCGADQCTTLAYGEMILKAAQDSRPNAIDVVETCETAGHCVMLSQPDWMARMCRRAAGENV